jgi:hypothetical protein
MDDHLVDSRGQKGGPAGQGFMDEAVVVRAEGMEILDKTSMGGTGTIPTSSTGPNR